MMNIQLEQQMIVEMLKDTISHETIVARLSEEHYFSQLTPQTWLVPTSTSTQTLVIEYDADTELFQYAYTDGDGYNPLGNHQQLSEVIDICNYYGKKRDKKHY